MTKFEQFWATVYKRFPSDTSAYFAKPLLKEAFDQGREVGRDDMRKSKKAEAVPMQFAP